MTLLHLRRCAPLGVVRVAGFLAVPFAVFWWTVPYVSGRTLGNDYGWFVPVAQMELQFALRTGTVPLFVPGFNGGQTASALTHGQLFHPLPHLAARMPGYWTGHALDAVTLLKLLSLGVTHLVLFRLLRRLGLGAVPAWLVAFCAVYNLRMLDSFRYNIALEAYSALLLLCASLAFLFLEPDLRRHRLTTALCSFLLVASGHPQWAYLGLIGASLFCAVLPFALPAVLPGWRAVAPLRLVATGFAAMAAGVVLASAYAVPFYFEFIRNNTWRVGRDYAWASDLGQSLPNLLRSLYDPLHCDVHGSFAGNALIVLVAGLPALRLFRLRVPGVMLALWGYCVLVMAAAAGDGTPLYRFLFDHAPLWSSFRVPGRVTLMMMPALLLMMAWAAAPAGEEGRGASPRLGILAAVAAVTLFIWHSMGRLVTAAEPVYSPWRINRLPSWADSLHLGLLVAALLALVIIGGAVRRPFPLEVACAVIVMAHAAVSMLWGTWRWPKKDTPSFAVLLAARRDGYWRSSGVYEQTLASGPVDRYMKTADRDPRLAWTSHRCIRVGSLTEAYAFVRNRRWPQELIVEGPPGLCGPFADGAAASSDDTVTLEYVSFNRVTFDVQTGRPGFLAVDLPYTTWDGTAWRAAVNGQPASILRANGISQAVAIPGGRSRVELRYWSWPAFIGVLMSAAAAAALVAYAAGALPRPGWAWAARITAVAVMAVCVWVWTTRLYAGQGWGTSYSWRSTEG